MTDTTAPARRPRKAAEAKAGPDLDAVHDAQRQVGNHLEEQRQERIARRDAYAELHADQDPRWDLLTAPFSPDEIEKLPKPVSRQDDAKARCERGSRVSADGFYCGGWHARSVHLDYVGHAGITMRLNTVLGPGGWEFRPYALTPDGLPAMSQQFYATLTLYGMGRWKVPGSERHDVTKWDLAANFSGPQEAVGDALRRCAMRFGVGTYLWSKSEAAAQMATFTPPETPQAPAAVVEPDPDAMTVWASICNATEVHTVGQAWQSNSHLLERTVMHDGITETLADAMRRLGDSLAGQ